MNHDVLLVLLCAVAVMLTASGVIVTAIVGVCVWHWVDEKLGPRIRRRREVRCEVKEANRILRRCQELDLDVDQVLALEAADDPFVD